MKLATFFVCVNVPAVWVATDTRLRTAPEDTSVPQAPFWTEVSVIVVLLNESVIVPVVAVLVLFVSNQCNSVVLARLVIFAFIASREYI